MKKIIILLLFSISLSQMFGQITLTYTNNGMLPGDSSTTREFNYMNPGGSGENQVWDFSGIQYTGKSNFCGVTDDPSLKAAGPDEKSLIISEDGYDYRYLSGKTGYLETGYVNNGKKITLDYSDPIEKMKYPFSYGQQFSDPFAGIAFHSLTSRIDLSGQYTVTADAYGTLILPDRILKNVLRVKSYKQSLQISVCGSTQVTVERYCWYAGGYRYPVLMVCSTENRYGVNDPVIVKNSWTNLNQQTGSGIAAAIDPKNGSETGENSVVVYPNPFTEQLTYKYFLPKQVPVTIELYDISGKFN
ncbi:MAG: hypothetical protein NTW16_10370, partial [Bacteroidetes bacterium]|nr:hypothetical protein [Bacteroidota bacterium]